MQARRSVVFALVALAAVTSGVMLAHPPQEVGTWASLGEVGTPLPGGAAVTLADGRTLIVGGLTAEGVPTASVTSFDPLEKSLTDAGSLVAPRSGHTATLLRDGRVLVVGGLIEGGLLSAEIEIFDPATATSSIVSLLPEPRRGHVAARRLDGTVLIAGGETTYGTVLRSAVSFDPETGTVSPVPGELRVGRVNASAATLLDGRVLIAGGSDGTTELASAEIYESYSHSFATAATTMSVARQGHSAILLPHNGGVLVVGGTSNHVAQAAADLFLPAVFPDPFSFGEGEFSSTGAMSLPRAATVAGPTSVEGFAFAAGGASDAEVYHFATIKTDTDDYAPGERAEITGSGWQPGEKVTLVFQEDPAVHDDYVLEVTADSAGNIYWNQWAPESHDLGVRFYLTATGRKSRAQMTFTDSTNTTAAVSTSPNPSAPGQNVTATATVMAGTTPVTEGVVKFYYGIGNCTGNAGTQFGPAAGVTPNSSGQASASTTLLTNGVAVRACYSGVNGNFQKSESEVVQAVSGNIATSTVVSSSSNPSTFGGSVTFSAVVTRTSSTGTPTGSVQFTIDGSNFGAPVALGAPSSATFATAVSAPISTLTVGAHAVSAVYIPTGNFVTSNDALDNGQVVGKADAVCTISGYTGTYDAASHGATGSCVGVGTDTNAASGNLTLGATFTDAPGGTANWSFDGGTNYNNQSGTVSIVINKADASCAIDGYTGTYDATAHGATGSCGGVDSGGTATGSSLDLGDNFTNAPGGTANWTFTGGTNYKDQNSSVAIKINQADAACTISGYSGTYDAAAHGATGSCAGVDIGGTAAGGNLSLGASFTDAPGGAANWSFIGGLNYKDRSGSVQIVIGKADAICDIDDYDGVYDGHAHGASGSCTGVDTNGATSGGSLDLGETFTNVPGGTATWKFTGGTNYNDQGGSVQIVIGKADAVCDIDGYDGVYDGHAHGASGDCTGVDSNGSAAGSSLDRGATFTNVPGGTATWAFNGGTNYNDQSGSVGVTITKADATVNVSGYTGVYDAEPHAATGTATGVMDEPLAGLALGAAFTDYPGGTAHWVFTDQTGNYNDASGDVSITISKANATVVVYGYSGTFNGQPHGATGHATGVGGVNLNAGLNFGSNFTNVPGGTAHWTFTGGLNYNDASGDAEIVIAKANAVCAVSGYDVVYDGAFHVATGACTGVNGAPLDGLNLTSTSHKDAGDYSDSWTFTDVTGNYNDANGTVADKIRHWTTSGFYQPVDMSGTQIVWNTVKGGSTVPLKFNLFAGAEKKTSVNDVKPFSVAEMACAMSVVETAVDFTTTGGTQLRYDGTAGQFIQNWQTPKTPGKCYMVRMTAQDGSTIDAFFKIK